HTHGRTGVRAANVHLQAARDLVMQGARVRAHASTGNGFKPQPVAQVGVSFSHGHDRGAIVAQRTGIAAGGPLSVRVA
ncbi:hemagglutinin repeat-containing protein, partial [Bordetella pertussis]|uniref:hemagglutinin repeat-containing protein n=1 Tax=Bordetella pertussis TaxID=520 RepID=UPI0012B41925